MNKIHKNIAAIEQKFYSFKTAHQLFNEPIPISQIVESITFGVITEKEVQQYLGYVHNSPEIEVRQKINQKWYELDIQEIMAFLDKVIEYKTLAKSKQLQMNGSPVQTQKKKKIKQPTSQAHENPYKPAKISTSPKKSIHKQQHGVSKESLQNKINYANTIKQDSKDGYLGSLLHLKSKSKKQPDFNSLSGQQKTDQIISDLPENFQHLPPKERYAILSKKYGKDKSILQKRFDSIYKHYRKEMFIPFESFQINNELLMDLRIFLKFYREFQVSKKFKTNQAIKHFKKIALNGLWLDDKKFKEIHYKLIDLLEIDQNLDQTIQDNINEVDVQKANQAKIQVSNKIKNLVKNILSIKELSDLISQRKVKQIFNNKESQNIVKKIVEVHSGLTKDDVMLKLQERVEQRKLKKNFLLGIFNQQKFGQLLPEKMQKSKILEDPTLRLSPNKQSVYEQLQIPKLRPRQMKKLSVYSSLQTLDIQKEKQKLKQLVNERENEQYLDAFFKKEKNISILPRSKSVTLSKKLNENEESTNGFTIDSTKSARILKKDSLFQRNLSLPRMKFN